MITTHHCHRCGCRVLGVNGRYFCTRCEYANPSSEGTAPLPQAPPLP
ncbi:hypothetical protein [Streptomyces sp. CC208A]|nr:hypothetical protein [Streptomyces sp. CC208A]